MAKSELRKRHEHMLIHVCGMDQETLDKKSDAEIGKLFKKHLQMM